MDLRPGAVIAGRYRVERKIGSGGMGEVWAAEHASIGVRVALKTLLPAAAIDQQVVARFRREAYLLGRLRSDRVARVVDFIEDRRFGLVLVMDFVEGEPLANVLEQRCLNVEEAIDLGVDIVTAVCDLHRAKIVHRDLKPDNIILEPLAGGRRRAVIVDFGVSRMESSDTEDEQDLTGITQADTAVGTIPYMAPEQFISSRDVTGAADLYAVGAILYRAVSGRHVFGEGDETDYAKIKLTTRAPPLVIGRFDRVARGLAAIVARALERVPDARFQSAEAMLAELTVLRDLARTTALDLEANTELAPPSDLLDAPTEDGVEQTRRMSRPPGATEDMLEESTLDSPAPVMSEIEAAPTVSAPPPTAAPSTAPSAAPSIAPSTQSGARRTVPSPTMTPAEPATPEPARAPASAPIDRGRSFSLRALVAAVLAALLVGVSLGMQLHRLLGR
jgi:serine/threonine-protein kinase